MPNKIIDAISARKKQIIWVLVIIGIFYLFSVWNVGSILSFLAFYDYGFAFLTINAGLNEWLARGILIPAAALMTWSAMSMLSLTNKLRRQIGAVTLVIILSALSFAMYFHTKAAYSSADNFSVFSGESFKRYSEHTDYVDVFPKTVRFHPITGVKLEMLTQEKASEFESKKKALRTFIGTSVPASKINRRDANGNTRLFNDTSGEANFKYYVENGRMDLFPLDASHHPTLGPKLSILSPLALESFKAQKRENLKKRFSENKSFESTGYYVLRGDALYFVTTCSNPAQVRIGENAPTKTAPPCGGDMVADSDGILFLQTTSPVEITGLSIRLYE